MKLSREFVWLIVKTAAAVLVFINSVPGDFVYDDHRQIVANPLIQDASLMKNALASDVWAFKGDGTISASNYWRPTFTAWCIVNFRLFGLDPFGWHLLNILLHAGVCAVGFLLLRRWAVPPLVCAVIVVLFAVHPVHTESVAWISGSPDVLFGSFFLLSIYFADLSVTQNKKRNLAVSLLFYLLALGSKEIALFCIPIFVLVLGRRGDDTTFLKAVTANKAWRSASVYLAAAVAYFFVRAYILGAISRPVENSPTLPSALLTAPSVFLFYVRQIIFPFWLGPNYPLRPVESAGLFSFVLPLLVSALLIAGLVAATRGSFVRRIGAALFILPLIPAFFTTAFPSEQIGHDRYLYLPISGFLIVAVSFLTELLGKRFPGAGERYVLIGAVPFALTMAVQTYSYNRIWLNDVSLWRHAVTVDPSSASNWRQLGAVLAENNDLDRADDAYQRSIGIRQDPLALMGRGRISIAKGDLAGAVRDLETIINLPPENLDAYILFQTYEALAVAHQQQKDLAAAERRLREARERLPIYRAAATEKLAVVLYLQNRKPEALAELESVRTQARTEMLLASKSVFLRLGMLYAETGRKAEARTALEEFLSATANAKDAPSLEERRAAAELLRSIR